MSRDVTRANCGMSCDKEELNQGRALVFNSLISFFYNIVNNRGIEGLFNWKMSYIFTDSGTWRVWVGLLLLELANNVPVFQRFLSLYILHCELRQLIMSTHITTREYRRKYLKGD